MNVGSPLESRRRAASGGTGPARGWQETGRLVTFDLEKSRLNNRGQELRYEAPSARDRSSGPTVLTAWRTVWVAARFARVTPGSVRGAESVVRGAERTRRVARAHRTGQSTRLYR